MKERTFICPADQYQSSFQHSDKRFDVSWVAVQREHEGRSLNQAERRFCLSVSVSLSALLCFNTRFVLLGHSVELFLILSVVDSDNVLDTWCCEEEAVACQAI